MYTGRNNQLRMVNNRTHKFTWESDSSMAISCVYSIRDFNDSDLDIENWI